MKLDIKNTQVEPVKKHESMSTEVCADDLNYWLHVHTNEGWELVNCFPNPQIGHETVIVLFRREVTK